jgi:MFS family permease
VSESTPPINVRRAGAIVALEGALGVAAAIYMVIRELTGHEDGAFISGYGTAAWFAILGGGVLAAGIALLTGRRWGRAIAVMTQILLVPVAFALITDSELPIIGTPVLVVLAFALYFLFSPTSMKWFAAAYEIKPGEEDEADARPKPVAKTFERRRKKRR